MIGTYEHPDTESIPLTAADLRALFDTWLLRVERIDAVADALGLMALKDGLRRMWFRLKQGPIRVLVTGSTSAGKSTLINALANEIVVPEGKHTTSPIPVWIESRTPDDCAHAEILYTDGRLGHSRVWGLYHFLSDFCYTTEQAGRGTGQEQYADVVSAHIRVGSPLLANSHVTLIDTPGVGVAKDDNARVSDVLKDGCEILIALFRDADIQQQHVKEYFYGLFVDNDAPLRSLLDGGRVFMVSNSGSGTTMNKKIAAQHLSASFGMQEDQLYVLNARHARIKDCGIYRYTNFLPKEYADEDWIYAEKSTKEEKQSQPSPRSEKQFEVFCEALSDAVKRFCADEDAVSAAVIPIRENLRAAQLAIETYFDDRREDIKNSVITPPDDLAARKTAAETKLTALNTVEKEVKAVFDDPAKPFGINWPADDKVFRDSEIPNVGLMITEDLPSADKTLQQLLINNGSAAVTVRVSNRMTAYKTACCDKVDSYILRELSNKISEQMQKIEDLLSPYLPGEHLRFMDVENEIQLNARAVGHNAMYETWNDTFPEETKEKSSAYLAPIRDKILAGGVSGGWSKFALYGNYTANILAPIARNAMEQGKLAYVNAYRDAMKAEKGTLYEAFQEALTKALSIAEKEKSDAEAEIEAYTKAVKDDLTARLNAYESKIIQYIEFGGEMPSYE